MYDWYEIFSLTEFEAEGLVSRKLEVFMEGLGYKEVLVTKGNTVGVTFEGVFLPVDFLSNNPFSRDGYAVYRDAENNVWLGVEVDE